MRRAILGLSLVTVAAPLAAQSVWLAPEGRGAVMLETFRPTFEAGGVDLLTGAAYLSGRIRLGTRYELAGELPVARVSTSFQTAQPAQTLTETTAGNPYVGMRMRGVTASIWAELGIRLPVVDGNGAANVGSVSDVDRFDAWVADRTAVRLTVGARSLNERGLIVQLRGGPEAFTGGGAPDVFLYGSSLVGYDGTDWALTTGIAGLASLTGDRDFSEPTLFEAGVLGELRVHRWRPGLQFTFPLSGDFRRRVSIVWGVRLAYAIP